MIVRKLSSAGPPEGLEAVLVEAYSRPDISDLGPGELLIRVRAASCNYPDMLMPSGLHQQNPKPPFVLGLECAGEVLAVGSAAAARFKLGDRVMHWPAPRGSGCMQSWVRADEAWVWPVPGELSWEEATGVPVAYMTAYTALVFRGDLRAGQTVLVLGATGGVGMAAVQMARAIGATVIAAGGADEKLRLAKDFGADHVVNYTTTPTFRKAVKEMTGGKGVDMVFDPVSGDVLMEALKCCNYGAKVMILGFAGKPVSQGVTNVPTPQILAKNLSVIGSGYDLSRRSNLNSGMKAIAEWIVEGKLRPYVHTVLPMTDVHRALRMLVDRQVVGKVVVLPP